MTMNYQTQGGQDYLYSDPLSFINNLISTQYPQLQQHSPLRPFMTGQADRLGSLADLYQMGGGWGMPNAANQTGADVLTQLFQQYAGMPQSQANALNPYSIRTMLTMSPASGQLQSAAEAAAQNASSQGGNAPAALFNTVFDFVSNTWGQHFSPGAQAALFSPARRSFERTLYTNAVAQGQFGGTPMEWLQSRGFM